MPKILITALDSSCVHWKWVHLWVTWSINLSTNTPLRSLHVEQRWLVTTHNVRITASLVHDTSQYMQQITVECTNLSIVQYMANLLLPQHITVHTAHHYTHNSTRYLSLYTLQCILGYTAVRTLCIMHCMYIHYQNMQHIKLCKHLLTIESSMSTSGIVVAVSLSSCPKEWPFTLKHLLCVRQVHNSSYVQIRETTLKSLSVHSTTHGQACISIYQGWKYDYSRTSLFHERNTVGKFGQDACQPWWLEYHTFRKLACFLWRW